MNEYFNWLILHISDPNEKYLNYTKLLSYLLDTHFLWTIENDKNRVLDGREYRDQYAHGDYHLLDFLNDNLPGPCSILEMLIALSVRIEYDIMHDPYTDEDRTWFWFWKMIENLGLDIYTDDKFNLDAVTFIVYRWMEHKDFTIFPLKGDPNDYSDTEIWSLMNRWLSENYDY